MMQKTQSNTLCSVINAIRDSGLLTKPEVARLLGITTVTAHTIINQLAESNIIIGDGTVTGGVGRKAVTYRINENYGHIIGVTIQPKGIIVKAFTLLYHEIGSQTHQFDTEYSTQTLNLIVGAIKAVMETVPPSRGRCLGIGVSVPGILDHRTGTVYRLMGIKGWNSIPLKKHMQEALSIGVYVDNDANAMALASKWTGLADTRTDAVFLSITAGIGAGVLCQGKLYYGKNSNAGEIGHITVDREGPLCRCGNRGCIEVFAADRDVVDGMAPLFGQDDIGMDRAVALALGGNAQAYGVFEEAARNTVFAVDAAVQAYDPETVIIGSSWLMDFPGLFDGMVDSVFRRHPWLKRSSLHFKLVNVSEFALMAPGAIALEEIYSQECPALLNQEVRS